MDKQTAIATALSAAITLLVTMVVGYFVGVFEQGVEAGDRALIREVVREEMTTDEGVTTKAAIATINRSLDSITTKVDGIDDNISEIREALLILASD